MQLLKSEKFKNPKKKPHTFLHTATKEQEIQKSPKNPTHLFALFTSNEKLVEYKCELTGNGKIPKESHTFPCATSKLREIQKFPKNPTKSE